MANKKEIIPFTVDIAITPHLKLLIMAVTTAAVVDNKIAGRAEITQDAQIFALLIEKQQLEKSSNQGEKPREGGAC